jgi:hypothetical protein
VVQRERARARGRLGPRDDGAAARHLEPEAAEARGGARRRQHAATARDDGEHAAGLAGGERSLGGGEGRSPRVGAGVARERDGLEPKLSDVEGGVLRARPPGDCGAGQRGADEPGADERGAAEPGADERCAAGRGGR